MPTLAIVSPPPGDVPLFEVTYPQALSGKHNIIEQLVLNSSLDMLEETMWMQKDMYLRVIDKYNDQVVSAYVTPSNYRFLLLHDGRNEDSIKAFFSELHELFTKVATNPLHEPDAPIKSNVFSDRVQQLARKHL